MSAANRGKVRRPIIPRWSSNIGFLLAHQVTSEGGAWVSCSRCGTWDKLDLAKLVIDRGPLLSLWNRAPRCKRCGNAHTFHGHHSLGTPVIPFRTDDPHQTDDLHRAYERERRRMAGMSED